MPHSVAPIDIAAISPLASCGEYSTAAVGISSVKRGSKIRRKVTLPELPPVPITIAFRALTVTVLAAGDGGGVEPNLQRWAMQWKQPDGSNPRDALKQSNRLVGGMNVIDVDITGTYTADERAMGGDKQYNEANWRMLLSWIQSPTGNYYVKVIGPAATVAHWESDFRSFVSSAAP